MLSIPLRSQLCGLPFPGAMRVARMCPPRRQGGPMSDPPGEADDGQWMTYSQIAARRGISKGSAERLVRRHRWRRQVDNQGLARALVPPSWLEVDRPDVLPDIREDVTPDVFPDITPAGMALETAISGLVARAERAEGEADRERQRAERAEEQRDQAVDNAAAASVRAEALRDRIEEVQARLAAAEADAKAANERAAHEHENLLDAEGRVRWAEEGREAEHERAENLQAERILVEERAGRAENQVFEMQAQVAAAQAAAEEAGRKAEEARRAAQAILEEDAARRRLGLLARLGRALRGE
jgi:hypothetical protein